MTDTDHISFSSIVELCLDEGLLSEAEYMSLIDDDGCYFAEPAICVHEAGHAVAAYVVGTPIESVSSEEWDEASTVYQPDGSIYHVGLPGGEITYAEEWSGPLTESQTAARMYREMMAALAGGYAAHRYTGRASEAEMSKGDRYGFASAFYSFCNLKREVVKPPIEIPLEPSDWARKDFERWCEANNPETSQRDLWSEVAQIIDERWHLVEGLTAVLMQWTWLTGEQVYEVFERIEARRAAAA